MVNIEINNLSKSFAKEGTATTVFDDVSFQIESRSFTTIMGPSGCGKSTVLNILAGLYHPDSGTITVNGEVTAPGDFFYGYVFQESRLLNWLTVYENIDIVLKAREIPKAERERRINQYLEMVGLADEKETYPLRLSGGMRQRVGIARALAIEPDVLLMDEPFSELDELTARTLRQDLIDIWGETKKTVIFVTHSINEAVFLSDKIVFMDGQGRLFSEEEIGIPRPRDFDDPELLQTERTLMENFLSNVGDI